jgi:CBS-domain-containing membrane protein
MKANDVMIRDVIAVKPDDDVAFAANLLADHDISALPVIDENRYLVGILSEADLLRREEVGTEKHRPWWLEAVTPASVLASDYSKSHARKVAELMSRKVAGGRGQSRQSGPGAGFRIRAVSSANR